MKSTKEAWSLRRVLWVIFMALATLVILHNIYLMSKDILFGDLSAEGIYPQPGYGFVRVPDTARTSRAGAENRLAIDFAQVYFPSQEFDSIERNYKNGVFDPLDRPSRYAPFVHYVCSITICKLDYGTASLIHMLVQICFFYFFFITAFRALGVASELLLGLLLVGILLFVSPMGLSWFERGQFSLYVALSHLLLIGGLMKNRLTPVLWSGVFAYIKWTSLPLALVVLAVFALKSRTRAEWVRLAQMASVFLLPFALFSLPFRSETLDFMGGLYRQELLASSRGISLTFLLPALLVKALPLLLILIGWLHLRRYNGVLDELIPYFIGAGVILLTYPTIAYEYSLPCLFCFIPLALYWTKLQGMAAPPSLPKYLAYSFFFFLILASFSPYINPTSNPVITMSGYFLFSVAMLLIPLLRPQDPAGRQLAGSGTNGSPAD